MSTALWPVQVALVVRLKATAGVTTLVGQRVYDARPPQGTPKPYILVGEGTETPYDVFGGAGVDDFLTCHVFSGGGTTGIQSREQAMLIVAAMDAALVAPLTITGWGSAAARPDFLNVPDPELDGTRHAVRRYRILAHAP